MKTPPIGLAGQEHEDLERAFSSAPDPQAGPGEELIWIRTSEVSALKAQLAALTEERDNLATELTEIANGAQAHKLAEAREALRTLGHNPEPGMKCEWGYDYGKPCPGCAVLAKMEGR